MDDELDRVDITGNEENIEALASDDVFEVEKILDIKIIDVSYFGFL